MSSNKEVEYTEATTGARHMIDYRAKIFSFSIVFNAALLVVMLEHLKTADAKLSVSILAISITLIFFLINRRVGMSLDRYFKSGKDLEKELGFSTMTSVLDGREKSFFRIHNCFQALYIGLIILWLAQCFFVITINMPITTK